MGTKTPKALQTAAFYLVGKMFSLRGGAELRNVKLSQLKRETNPDRYVYTENVSKNNNGTYKQLHIKCKVVPLYRRPELETKGYCPVQTLDEYISKLPSQASTQDVFVFRLLEKKPDYPKALWYSPVPVGKHTLNEKLAKMCALRGIEGRVTNHSVRATSATHMYEQGVPEKVIQDRTGHRSLEALRVYERTSALQQETASNILSSSSNSTYSPQIHVRHQQST